jgi:hypothetical protein
MSCYMMEILRQGQRRRDAETGSKAEKVDGLTIAAIARRDATRSQIHGAAPVSPVPNVGWPPPAAPSNLRCSALRRRIPPAS